MRLAVALVIAGCSSAPPAQPTQPISNAAGSTQGSAPAAPSPMARGCKIGGFVIDKYKQPAIGATVVLTGGMSEQVEITDDKGIFVIDAFEGTDRMTIYYDNKTTERAVTAQDCFKNLDIVVN